MMPALVGIENSVDLPNASSFCGACESVCPVRIPLPKLMRHWRERAFERHLVSGRQRFALAFWGFFARHPGLYRLAMRVAVRAFALIDARILAKGWTESRDFPAPQGETFQAQFAQRARRPSK